MTLTLKKMSTVAAILLVSLAAASIIFLGNQRLAQADHIPFVAECADLHDNDGDGYFDFVPVIGTGGLGPDPDCTGVFDEDEGPFSPPPPPPPAPQCSNGVDDDGDGLIDLNDPNCADADDDSEAGVLPQCIDGVDNDGDGKTDWGVPTDANRDPGCSTPLDNNEGDDPPPPPPPVGDENTLLLCSDGADNDGDSLIDLADSDCSSFQPKLVVVKTVINDNGGTSVVSGFSLYIGTTTATTTVVSGATTTVSVGTWTVGELPNSAYTATFGGDCNSSGQVTLGIGDTKTCTITNNDVVPASLPACSDGTDNDGDGLVDLADPGCNNSSDTDEANAPAAPPTGGGGGGGGGGVSNPIFGVVGQVLGVSTSTPGVLGVNCNALINGYLRRGRANNLDEVKRLQEFLNKEVGANLPITGFFGALTEAAVNKFQLKHSVEVLSPWLPYGLASAQTPTGYVYKTTLRKINLLHCSSLSIPMPTLP